MKNEKDLEKAIEDFSSIETKYPKWIDSFRKRYYKNTILPFLVVYHAVGIGKSLKDKSRAIAIATKYAQDKGYLFKGSNELTLLGEVREIAVMKRLGEKKTLTYLKILKAQR
jgi:hypothetical protein